MRVLKVSGDSLCTVPIIVSFLGDTRRIGRVGLGFAATDCYAAFSSHFLSGRIANKISTGGFDIQSSGCAEFAGKIIPLFVPQMGNARDTALFYFSFYSYGLVNVKYRHRFLSEIVPFQ
ncbi:hypothetical protein PA3000047 [Pseudomonas phage vB_PaeM_HZ_ZJUPA3]